jgi:hypothetical protein
MLTIEDFIAKYETFTDSELYSMYNDVANYSEDAGNALNIVIEKKGGLNALIKRLQEKAVSENEKQRIANEATKFGLEGVDASFLKNTTQSLILSKEEVNEIIDKYAAKSAAFVEDKKVNVETITKSFVGSGLASMLGGAFASLQFIYFGATSLLMVVGVALICYFTVKFVTKKSYNNTAVIMASFIAFVLSYLLAYGAYQILGYLG